MIRKSKNRIFLTGKVIEAIIINDEILGPITEFWRARFLHINLLYQKDEANAINRFLVWYIYEKCGCGKGWGRQ
jgi:hypothetical protein